MVPDPSLMPPPPMPPLTGGAGCDMEYIVDGSYSMAVDAAAHRRRVAVWLASSDYLLERVPMGSRCVLHAIG
jgi:hypothetical protein